MKIAIPVSGGELSPHFGHCSEFVFMDVDENAKTIIAETREDAPPHQPGVLPRWVSERGANMIFAGGMGPRAIDMFEARGVTVLLGVESRAPRALVKAWLEGGLSTGDSSCDHPEGHGHGGNCGQH